MKRLTTVLLVACAGVPPEQVEVGEQASMSVDIPTTADDPATRLDCAAGARSPT
ncbi:MAG TPA: hypothetical protein VGP26_30730 [Actinophytocola sp.]|jgi:hypothetical protein|nr:hypothetical protein [Actinophytocola sp.]